MSLSYVLPYCGAHPQSAQPVGVCAWTGRGQIHSQALSFRGKRVRVRDQSYSTETAPIRCPPKALFSGGGIFGVGTSEVIVIVAVGWFLLGPEKLFKLAKDTGRIIGELRKTASEAREQFSEALELDVIAAEMNGSAKPKSTGTKSVKSEATDGQNEPVAGGNGVTTSTPVTDETKLNGPETQAGPNQTFLNQLQRVSDPNQVAPSEVPDLGVEMDELEVQRLEREYLEAKRRLEMRKQKKNAEASVQSVPEEER